MARSRTSPPLSGATPAPASAAPAPHAIWIAASLIGLVAVVAYGTTFSVPLLLDDIPTLTTNPSLHLLGSALFPPDSVPSGGRPLLNLSFAINHVLGGTAVGGYHAVNLLIHLLAGLTLLGVVRRTLLSPALGGRFTADTTSLAAVVALLWVAHPLQTSAVTYISQRAESLMGLCYLLTWYLVVRGAASAYPWRWYGAAIAACLAGMATKEVMATAPVVIFLYDTVFLAGSGREAWRRRAGLYLGLGATWAVLAALMLGSSVAGRGVGYGGGYSAWSYLLVESQVIVRYLRLALWPAPLVFDYGSDWKVPSLVQAAPYLLALLVVFVGVVAAWRRYATAAFAGLCIFFLLGPTSSVVPIFNQPMAESRMYLPLAAILTLGVLGLHRFGRRVSLATGSVLVVVCLVVTAQRNRVYADDISLWSDTIAKFPENSRAHNNLGNALAVRPGRELEALAQFEEALRIRPDYPEAHNNLANALARIPERRMEALPHFEATLRLSPGTAEPESNYANLLAELPGRLPDAIAHFEKALRLKPDAPIVHNNLAHALARSGQLEASLPHFEAAVRLDPAYAKAHTNFANALSALGRDAEAITHYEAALRLLPDSAPAHNSLANALAATPATLPRALTLWETALRLDPTSLAAHYNYGRALLSISGRQAEARAQFEAALRLSPDFTPAREMLDRLGAP